MKNLFTPFARDHLVSGEFIETMRAIAHLVKRVAYWLRALIIALSLLVSLRRPNSGGSAQHILINGGRIRAQAHLGMGTLSAYLPAGLPSPRL